MADVTATWHWYPRSLIHLLRYDNLTLGSGTFKVALYHSTSNAVASMETLNKKMYVTQIVSSTNYADGTATVAATVDTTHDKLEVRISDGITFGTTVSATAKFAVLYKSTGSTSTEYVIGYMTFPSVITAEAGSITMNQNDADNAALTLSYS